MAAVTICSDFGAHTGSISLTFLAPETISMKEFFHRLASGDGFEMIQVHYVYCALYLCYISSNSHHQVLDSRGWGSLL